MQLSFLVIAGGVSLQIKSCLTNSTVWNLRDAMEHYAEGIMFDNLYIPYDHEISAFGKNWIGPNKYPIWD